MVFGWGKKKEEKHDEAQEQKISLLDVPGLIQKHKQTKQEEVLQSAKPRFETIKKELESVLSIIDHLESDNLKLDDVDTRLKVIVVRGKTEVVETISKEANYVMPKINSYEAVVKCADSVSHILKKIGDVLGKNTRIIHIFAKKYAQDLKMHLETITVNHDAIFRLIKEVDAITSAESEIKEKKEKYTVTVNEISEKMSHVEKSKNFLQALMTQAEELDTKIKSKTASQEYAQFLKVQNELKSALNEEVQIDKEIDDEFSKISRPLGKYVYVTSLEKPLKVLLEQLVQNPSKVLTKDSKGPIVTVLESCMKGVISGTVSVKENEKTVSQITHLISILDTLIERKMQKQNKISEIRQSLDIFNPDVLADLEKKLEVTREDIENTKSKINSLESEVEDMKRHSLELLGDLMRLLHRTVGTKYVVTG
jgi:chromosome segregation ATPase